jgi:hypothetical protein
MLLTLLMLFIVLFAALPTPAETTSFARNPAL